ncbi:hypothetical protein J0910_22185 [Nocardiopsis sp. CNT-189]|uniref:hypothetical protein n=1 Tax=Nocardiopsis oceanisediminis TaxID=2816862 RepID=UPI003B2A499B
MDTEATGNGTLHPARCPDCGWPEDQAYRVVSRHTVSAGQLLYTRCPCGRLSTRLLRIPGAVHG